MLVTSALIIGALLVSKLSPMLRAGRQRERYVRLDGDGRADILRIYLSAERLLRRAGLAARGPSQTLAEYAAQASATVPHAKQDLAWLRKAAWAAAYDPTPYGPVPLAEAREHLHGLRISLKR